MHATKFVLMMTTFTAACNIGKMPNLLPDCFAKQVLVKKFNGSLFKVMLVVSPLLMRKITFLKIDHVRLCWRGSGMDKKHVGL